MPAHVDHQHVLGLEGLLFSRAILPSTHKLFLLPVDVVIVDVLQNDRTEKNNPYILHVHKAKTCFALTDFQFKKALAQIFSISSSAMFSITFVPAQLS